MIENNYTSAAQAVARETGWNIEGYAREREWTAVGIGPVGQHRDSELLERHNFATIFSDLQERFPDAVDDVSFGHWGVGWVDELAFNAAKPEVLAAVQAWADALETYPVADEDAYSVAEYDETLDTLERCYGIDAELVGDVFSALCDIGCDTSPDYLQQRYVDEALDAVLTERLRGAAGIPQIGDVVAVADRAGVAHTVLRYVSLESASICAVGDDYSEPCEFTDMAPLADDDYCGGCGQIGCSAGH